MTAERVISGKYSGNKIGCDPKTQMLYVVIPGGRAYFEPDNIAHYELRPQLSKSDSRVYVVRWVDEEKSLIRIPKFWEEIFISGCENGPISEEELKQKNKHAFFSLLPYIIILGLFFGLIFGVAIGNSNSSKGTEEAKKLTWSEWDRAGQRPSADMLVETTESLGLAQNAGVVSGYFINNSNKTYRHLEAIYGVYNSNGNRIGRCIFSTNDVYLAPNQEQGFTATCNAWGDSPIIKLESVGFKEKPLTN